MATPEQNRIKIVPDNARDEKLKDALVKVADYIHDNNIKTVVAIGASAVHPARALRTVYAKKYGGKFELHSLGNIADNFGYKGVWEKAAESIKSRRGKLISRLDEPIMLFDEEVGWGATMNGAKTVFQKLLNAKNVHTGALVVPRGFEKPLSIVGHKEDGSVPTIVSFLPLHSIRGRLRQERYQASQKGQPKPGPGLKMERETWLKTQKDARGYWNRLAREI